MIPRPLRPNGKFWPLLPTFIYVPLPHKNIWKIAQPKPHDMRIFFWSISHCWYFIKWVKFNFWWIHRVINHINPFKYYKNNWNMHVISKKNKNDETTTMTDATSIINQIIRWILLSWISRYRDHINIAISSLNITRFIRYIMQDIYKGSFINYVDNFT